MGTRDRGEHWDRLTAENLRSLDEWMSGKAYNIELDRWLTGGSSAIPIAVVRRSGNGYGDKMALKFFKSAELIERWNASAQNCPPGFKKHIIQLQDTSPTDSSGLLISLLAIGGGDISTFRPLAELAQASFPKLTKACRIIVQSIIREWNPPPRTEDYIRKVSVSDYFNGTFDRGRIQRGSTLHQLLDAQSVDVSAKFIRKDLWAGEELLPNPLTFAHTLHERTLHGFYGRAHRDLHAWNILLSLDPFEPNNYRLIDLEYFSSAAPLARDPMILLLSIAKEWMRGIKAGSLPSRELIRVIVNDPSSGSVLPTHQKASREIHAVGYRWAAEQASSGDDWTAQSLLSLAACALRYASRKHADMEDADAVRAWYFDLAAVAALRYLEKTEQWTTFKKTPAADPSSLALKLDKSSIRKTDDEAKGKVIITEDKQEGKAPCENERAGAIILDFSPSPQNQWPDLVESLQALDLNSTDWRILSAKTGRLRMLLSQEIPNHPNSDELQSLLLELDSALGVVISPHGTSPELNSALYEIKRIATWILDLLLE